MSEYKYLDKDGLIYYHSKIKTLLAGKVDTVSGKGLSTNDYTTAEKNKLSGIATGAEVNQNAFSNVVVGETTIQADSKTDTLTLEAGSNVTLTPNTTSDKITIAATDTTYSEATTSAAGLMSSSDKTKLNGIASNAQVNVIETIKVNGTALTPSSKAVDITVPQGTVTSIATSGAISGGTITSSGTITHSTAAGYKHIPTSGSSGQYLKYGGSSGTASWASPDSSLSSSSTNTTMPGSKAVYDAIQAAISSITGISFEIVQTLPTTGQSGVIYLVPNSGTAPNIYDEYIWVASTSKFEKIGTTDVDLSGYVQASEMVTITNAEIDTIVA